MLHRLLQGGSCPWVGIGARALDSACHATNARFEARVGVKVNDVPLKGTAELVTDALGNHLDSAMSDTTFARAQKDRVRVLAIVTEQPQPLFPNGPTFREPG
ncbi:MAG: tripartite tricarboxylate transporter substrate-binding protein [Casimicrobiaceae bacterium]|nr:tripartite tricarboxylate transporter substrate-binding protein [Casimicrobiaceae bacterium]MDW8313031.1 tripartite tricarboxylate transporter substrate-binding protein [Burkholderiales bacterium]